MMLDNAFASSGRIGSTMLTVIGKETGLGREERGVCRNATLLVWGTPTAAGRFEIPRDISDHAPTMRSFTHRTAFFNFSVNDALPQAKTHQRASSTTRHVSVCVVSSSMLLPRCCPSWCNGHATALAHMPCMRAHHLNSRTP